MQETDIVIRVPEGLHPLSRRFVQIMSDNIRLHIKKGRDYGAANDPFSNVRASVDWGVPAWVGCMIRANDKVKRLQTMATKGSLANESAVDSFADLSVYAAIGQVLFEQDYGLLPADIVGETGQSEASASEDVGSTPTSSTIDYDEGISCD